MIGATFFVVDVFEEVEEELRSARYKRLAFTVLPIVGGVLLLALIAALAWWGWDSFQNSKADKASVAYERGVEAIGTGDTAGARTAFVEAAKEGNGAYKSMALQQQAGLAVSANNDVEAIRLFDEAAKAASDPILSDAASLKAAYLVMNTSNLADAETRLTPLAEEKRPYRPFAQLALGMVRLQAGKTAEARSAFVLLTLGQDVPDGVRQQAQTAIETIDSGTAASILEILKAQAKLPPLTPQQIAALTQPMQQGPAQ
ncbi:tetratricopeptide repeat protein [soil metagenome]